MSGAPVLALLAVVFGSVGACARAIVVARCGTTAAVNLPGALLLGLMVGAQPPAPVLLVAGAGFLGAFTTFSTWVVEGAAGPRTPLGSVAGQLVGGLAAAALGLGAGAMLGG